MRPTPRVAFAAGLLACGLGLVVRPLAEPGAARAGADALTGHVVDRATGQPIPEAIVTLSGGNPIQRAVASTTGAFAFQSLTSGSYVVRADRPGYLSASAGQRTPAGAGEPIAVADGQAAPDVVVSLWRAGSIAGTVVGPAAAPMSGVEVHALQRVVAGGTWQWADVANAPSDDRGRYRLGNLGPGEFLVVARPAQNPETTLLMALFTANAASAADVMANIEAGAGGAPALDSRVPASTLSYFSANGAARPDPVTLAVGAARTGIVLHVKQAHGVRLSGSLAGASVPTLGLIMRLTAPIAAPGAADAGGEQAIEIASAACDEQGRFEFSNVLPGHYRLTLTWMPPLSAAPPGRPGGPPPRQLLPTEPAISADQPVIVGATDVTGIRVDAHEGFRITGRVAAAGGASIVPGLETTAVRVEPVDARVIPALTAAPSRFVVDGSGRVTSSSIAPGRYLLRVVPPRGWTVVSATSGDRDLLDDPVDLEANIDDLTLTLTNGPLGAATGVIVTSAGTPAGGATALLFPANAGDRGDTSATARRIRQVRVPAGGAFTFGNLPPGDYLAVAIASDPRPDWQAPESLRALARSATPVTIALGQTQTTRLEVSR